LNWTLAGGPVPAFHRTPIRGSQQPIYIGEPLNPFAFVLHLYLRHLRNWEEEPPNVHIRVIVAFRPLSRAVDASAHRITLGAGGLDVVLFFGLSGSVRGVFLLPEVAVWCGGSRFCHLAKSLSFAFVDQ